MRGVNRIVLSHLLCIVLIVSVNAEQAVSNNLLVQDTISGEFSGTIKNSGSHYLVTGDLIVPFGRTLVIESGVVLLFKNFTGIKSDGVLIVKGSAKSPVVFTSEKDTAITKNSIAEMQPAPYDWNGITISENGAGSSINYCQIRYSLYGLVSVSDMITVRQCTFLLNGRSDLEIAGKSITVDSSSVYLNSSHSISNAGKIKTSYKPVLALPSLLVASIGAMVGIIEFQQWRRAERKYKNLSDVNDICNLSNPKIMQEWSSAKEHRNTHRARTFGFLGVACLGSVGFVVSLKF